MRVAFNNVSFSSQGMPSRIYPPTQGRPNLVLEAPWLYLMVELRRSLPPDTCITNANIRYRSFQLTSPVPESALRWILKEAIPPGAEVDHQRAERLFEDFESFLLLWAAEDSERGRIAREERKKGDLVDVAMCNRWKQFENVRRAGFGGDGEDAENDANGGGSGSVALRCGLLRCEWRGGVRSFAPAPALIQAPVMSLVRTGSQSRRLEGFPVVV